MRNTKWVIKNTPRDKDIEINNIPIDKDVLKILYSRGIKTKSDIKKFLNPTLENIRDPYGLEDMEKAVTIICNAIEENKNIWIYGDYDVDGITSTSILYLALKELGAKNIDYYIPIRDEGYGLNNDALKKIKDSGGELVITVDCGIVSFEEINYANSIGLSVIVTDHHNLQGGKIPSALAVVNPKREQNTFPIDYLAGVGTIFMVLIAIFEKYNKKEEAFKYLDLVAIGTVADIVPLLEENRIFVKFGLEKLLYTKNRGLAYLLFKLFSEKGNFNKMEFTTYDVGFIIAPVFNAAGRLKDAKMVVKLLTSDNDREIEIIVKELINKNFERKELQNNIVSMIEQNIEKKDTQEESVIVDYSPNYHHGVIGIAASKIVDTYYKPVIIMEEKQDEGIAVASCRSIENFNILEALQSMSELFIKFGGHSGAAGFTIPIKNIKLFVKKINDFAKKKLSEKDFVKRINIDKQIPIQKVSYEFFKTIELLKPFGFGNPSPTFLTKNVIIENVRYIGESKNHIMFDFKQKGFNNKNAVWFGAGENFKEISKDLFYDIVFKLKLESYQDKLYIKVYIDDIKKSELKDDTFNFYHSLYSTSFPIKSIFYTNLDLDEEKSIFMKREFDQISIFNGRKFVGKLDYNISNLLILLKEFYNWDFQAKIDYVEKNTGGNKVNIIVKRNYDFENYNFDDLEIFKKIKKFLLGNMEYNSKTKEILSQFFKENKNLILLNKKEKGLINNNLENTILTLGIYYKEKYGLNSKIILKNTKNIQNNFVKNYFDIINKYEKSDSMLYILYLKDIKNEIINDIIADNKRFIIILDNEIEDINIENTVVIKNEMKIPENIVFLSTLNKQQLKGIKNVYTKYLPISRKIKLKEKLLNGEIINCDDNIWEIL